MVLPAARWRMARVAVDRAAAGGDHAPVRVDAEQHGSLDLAQPQVAPGVDDLLQRAPLAHLDRQIGIHEVQRQALRQQHTHRALAGPGHADQRDAASLFRHCVVLYSAGGLAHSASRYDGPQ